MNRNVCTVEPEVFRVGYETNPVSRPADRPGPVSFPEAA